MTKNRYWCESLSVKGGQKEQKLSSVSVHDSYF